VAVFTAAILSKCAIQYTVIRQALCCFYCMSSRLTHDDDEGMMMMMVMVVVVVVVSRQMYSGGRLGQSDFFAVELFDAMLYLVVDLGDGVRRFNFQTHATPLSDGSAHYVKVERSTSAFSLLLDNDTRPVDIGGRNTSLDLGI